jgi:hypothetical protein
MEVNKFEEQVQEFGLEYLTFGGPRMNTVEDEDCKSCPKVKRMFTKSTKVHAPHLCGHKSCGNSVCEDCVVCHVHSYYKCPECNVDTYWKECIFGEKKLYNLAVENPWKFIDYFANFNMYPWLDEEVLVSCNRCFQKVLFEETKKRSMVRATTSVLSINNKRTFNLSEETEKFVTRVRTSLSTEKKSSKK